MLGFEKLTSAVVTFLLAVAAIGGLPRLVLEVHQAQARLIHESKASKWGQLPLLR